MNSSKIIELVIITNRNYGLYGGYSTSILGLKTLVLYIMDEENVTLEPSIWPKENQESYRDMLRITKTSCEEASVKNFSYEKKDNKWHIHYENKAQHLVISDSIILALSKDHTLSTKEKISYNDFEIAHGLYIIGENAIYKNKIFDGDVYMGEASLVAQQVYQKIRQTKESITIHSTDII